MLRFLNFTFIDFLDILMVAVIIFIAFRWIKGSTAVNIFIAIILLLLQYIPYFAGSDLMWPQYNMYGVWLFPMLVILPGAAVVSRIIYRKTKNPYLPGIICGVMVAVISCTNTLTMIG